MEFQKTVIENTDIFWYTSKDRRTVIVKTMKENEWSLRPNDQELDSYYYQKTS